MEEVDKGKQKLKRYNEKNKRIKKRRRYKMISIYLVQRKKSVKENGVYDNRV